MKADILRLYDELQQQLNLAGASMQASEVHGVISGQLAISRDPDEDWFDELFDHEEEGDLLVQECKSRIRDLSGLTRSELDEFIMEMPLLLPDENVDLKLRAEALSLWCSGFLFGLGLSGRDISADLAGDAREVMQDLTEMTRMDTRRLTGTAEEIEALDELIEFVQVAALLVRTNLMKETEYEQD